MKICRSFIDAMGDQMLVIDSNYEIVMANKAFLKNTGLTEDEVVGRHCYEVTHHSPVPCQPPNNVCPLGSILSTGDMASVTHVHFDSQGNQRYIDIVASPVRDPSGKLVGVIESMRDITRQKQLEEDLRLRNAELEDEKRRREDFTSTVCHELNNILTGLGMAAQQLERCIAPELTTKYARMIVDQSKRLKRLVKDMSDASAIESQRLSLNIQRCDIVAIVRQSAEEQQMSTQKHRLLVDAPETLLVGDWDGERLRQVVDNLMSNAIKYSPNGGLIRVTVRRQNDEVFVSVTDQGVGIPSAFLPHIFQAYARAHREISGVGLGLFICKGIVEAHGGRIWVTSKEHEGSTFAFVLPMRRSKA